jgi:RNA-directed DNA polymerase
VKGLAVMQRDEKETSTIQTEVERVMGTKLSSITKRAKGKPKEQFTSLAHLLSEDFLKVCFGELKRDKVSGTDGVRVEDYEVNLEANLKDLVTRMKSKSYRPKAVRRVYIPKTNGTTRPLGIPAVEDKIVQKGIKKILEAIFEVDFIDVSYGFRPNRNCHQALNAVDKAIMTKPTNLVVDMDIEKFFDTIDHKRLIECLMQRVKDTSLIRLVVRFLKAGIMEEGKFMQTDKGTPQGGILSPLLANIYLHYILDLWFEKRVKSQLKGYAQLVRYADDFVVCFQSKTEAEAFSGALKSRLAKFGMKIAEGKTRVIEFGRYFWKKEQRFGRKPQTFDFLGFTHYCDKTRNGKFKLGRKTARVKLVQKMKAMNTWLKNVRNTAKLKEWWPVLSKKLAGHYRYYGVSGNSYCMRTFHSQTVKLAFKWINRRSQKKSYNWSQFKRFLQFNSLPKPKIYHNLYTLSSYLGRITEEPNVGNPQVRFCEGY